MEERDVSAGDDVVEERNLMTGDYELAVGNSDSVRILEYRSSVGDAGMTVKEVMSKRLKLSTKEIVRCKQFDDGVMVKRAYPGEGSSDVFLPVIVKSHLQEGDILRIKIYEANENAGEVVASDIPIDIVYEDEDIILLNKPGDMVVHPSYAHPADSLSNGLAGYYGKTGQKHVIRTIGRLDRETSGLILFAKNRYSAAVLSNQRENMSKRKEYLALAHGVFEEKEGTVDAPIGRVEGDRMIRKVMEDGKRAVTHFRVLEQLADFALIQLVLDTGRTHQIRVHMAHIGHPLLGDSLYGKEIPDSRGLTLAALHAAHLEFAQPVSGEMLSFEAEMPKDMKDVLGALGKR